VFLILVKCKLVVRNDCKEFVPAPSNKHRINNCAAKFHKNKAINKLRNIYITTVMEYSMLL